MLWASIGCVVADTNCNGYNPSYPNHYCDCENKQTRLYALPLDVMVNDSIWFKTSSSLFTNGFTAYLYSDCDVQFDIYQKCLSQEALYRVTIPKGQARDVTAESIKQKLEEAGMLSGSMGIYLCIYPIDGEGGRLICYPYNTGYNSTCNDILSLLPGMTFVSSHAENVYEITSDNIADSYNMYLQWSEVGGAPCGLQITRGSCNGTVIAEHNFTTENDIYLFDEELLMDVRAKGESLFAHFSHNVAAVGRISFREAAYVDMLVDTVICQGKVFKHENFETAVSAIYRYDTVQVSPIYYEVLGYNIVFAEPEVQYDTLALRNNQLPYNYRGKAIEAFGNYDLVMKNAGECDEHLKLNVHHNLTTITQVKDTTLCYGGRFDYEGGGSYMHDVTLTDSTWNVSRDTLTINIINVYFNTQDFAYDTLALTKKQSEKYRYDGAITIEGFGDYEYNKYDKHNCPVTVYLHVKHKVTNINEVIDTTLCDGEVYRHTDGMEYRTSVELVDSGWVDDDTYRVAKTNVRFITNELMYDTLYLRYADLPYIYKNQVLIREMEDKKVSILFGKCTGQVLLHLVHTFETTTAEEDVTLCEGRVYVHDGVEYREAATIVDSMWVDRDTYLIKTTRVHFTAPELAYDTIALRASELPYEYREQYTVTVGGFGDHEMTIKTEGECDERIALHVLHRRDTVYASQDTTLCEGKGYEHKGKIYYEPVSLLDSVWMNIDTMLVTTTQVHFAAPEMQYDTMALKVADLPYMYRGQYSVTEFGDHDAIIRNEGECDELYRIHIYHNIDTVVAVRDTVICFGGVYVYYDEDGIKINQKTDIGFGWQSVLNVDTVMIDSLYVRFEKEPSVVYDTVMLPASKLPYSYDIYRPIKEISSFGDYSYSGLTNYVTKCKENVYLHLVELAEERVDVTVCEGKGYERDGVVYYEPMVFVDSAWVTPLKYQITTTYVHFAAPEVQYDTLALRFSEMPYIYRGEEIAGFGEHDLTISVAGECDERVMLYVSHLTTTVEAEKDTTICAGKGYEHEGEVYYEPATIVDSIWVNQDTFLVKTIRVQFIAPEVVDDAIVLRASELPYVYREQYTIPADGFGEHDVTIRNEGECDERIRLMVGHKTDTVEVVKDTTLCEGKAYVHDGVKYYEPVEIVDSAWLNVDTMVVTTTRVSFAEPEMQYDTLELRTSEFPYLYRGQYLVNEFGSHDVIIRNEGECDEFYKLSIYHKTDTVVTVRDTVICFGGVYEYEKNGMTISVRTDISFGKQEVLNVDTVLIDSLYVRFAKEPDLVFDTLILRASELPYKYFYNKKVDRFTDYKWEGVNNTAIRCKENVYLHVAELVEQTMEVTLCEGDGYMHDGVEYMTSVTLVDSVWIDPFKYQITTTHVSFKAIETKYDTITLRTTDLPYDYRGEQIVGFGEHDLMIDNSEVCDEHIMLYVEHLTTTMEVERDTAICQGKMYEHSNGELYSEPATIVDSIWVNQDTLNVVVTQVYFTEPEMEYDTVFVSAGELNRGYYYELANQYIYSPGEYYYEILVEGECTREISLWVVRSITTAIDDNESVEVKSQLIMIDGVIYIFYNGEYYTLMGERVERIVN